MDPSALNTSVAAGVQTLTDEGMSAITAVGGALITLAATVVVYKWAKSAFFS